ncbi:MAG: VOC family protein [Pseudomonadota bacterium]|nr:VOC family protein [Pseudomonadota bacterium]
MISIEKVDHVGIRVRSKADSIAFYETLGFKTITDTGFDQGHPIIMQHPSGVVLNLLGPATAGSEENILMDVPAKHPGITHVSFKITDMDATKAYLASRDIPLTGEFNFKGMHAIFVRDPDRNVIELDAYVGEEPATRSDPGDDAIAGYQSHPD